MTLLGLGGTRIDGIMSRIRAGKNAMILDVKKPDLLVDAELTGLLKENKEIVGIYFL